MASKWRDGGRTKKQWMDAGYKLKEGAQGFGWYYWTYYEPSEVEKMTEEEYEAHKAGIREYRNWLSRERRRKKKELEEQYRRNREEWEKFEKERIQRIQDKIIQMENNDTCIALVRICGEGGYHYEVPKIMKVGDEGIFPFGQEEKLGVIDNFTDPKLLEDEYWFPDKLRSIKEAR